MEKFERKGSVGNNDVTHSVSKFAVDGAANENMDL